jgi:hypothetical protein
MRTVQFRCDALFRSYAVLRLKRGGGWHRISLAFAYWLVANKWARLS